MSHLHLIVFIGAVLFGLAGCSATPRPEGKPLPDMTFQHMPPFPVRVDQVEIVNRYDPDRDPADFSSRFPTPPDIALRRYAETRLQAAGEGGTFFFVIEEAKVTETVLSPASPFLRWMGAAADKDRYDVLMTLRLYQRFPDGAETPHAVLTFEKSLTIPRSRSLADREQEQFAFLELMMQDVDQVVTATIRDNLLL
ncbi:MAG: hypothetical protein KDJ15_07110 [Alphaproteobacteria bacterium]|nr:hypothetical protein [Alphaproteobacteria bacterium]